MKQDFKIPVIAIDGGAGTGKGTTRSLLCIKTGFHGLDSGVLYRAVGCKTYQFGIDWNNISEIESVAKKLDVQTIGETVILDGIDQTRLVRSDEGGKYASIVAKIPGVRAALKEFELAMRKPPGLVADGRDMGGIFETPYRFFIETDPEEKARRRVLQFQQMKLPTDYETILAEIVRRDESDKNNPANPLRPHEKAIKINNTYMTKEEVVEEILSHCKF